VNSWAILATEEERVAALPKENREQVERAQARGAGVFLYFTTKGVPVFWKEDELDRLMEAAVGGEAKTRAIAAGERCGKSGVSRDSVREET